MSILVAQIQNRFSKASITYDTQAFVQKQAAEFLVNKVNYLMRYSPEKILDLGSGTGYVPQALLRRYPKAQYSLNDIADGMLDFCKHKFKEHKHFQYDKSDISKIKINHHDLIISNFAFQWVDRLNERLKYFKKQSNVFAFSTLIHGTFQEWYKILKTNYDIDGKSYPRASELIEFCTSIKEKSNFWCDVKKIDIEFDSPIDFIKYLKNIGASTNAIQLKPKDVRLLIEKKKIRTSYVVLFGIFHSRRALLR